MAAKDILTESIVTYAVLTTVKLLSSLLYRFLQRKQVGNIKKVQLAITRANIKSNTLLQGLELHLVDRNATRELFTDKSHRAIISGKTKRACYVEE